MISTKHAHEKIGTETQYRTTWFGGRGPARGGAEGAKGEKGGEGEEGVKGGKRGEGGEGGEGDIHRKLY